MTIKLQRYLIISVAALLLCPVLAPTAARADLAPTWQYELPGGGNDNFDGAILGMYTEPGHSLLYVWTFDGDVYAFNKSGSIVWKGFMDDTYYVPAINPAGDLWLIGTEKVRAYSLKGELLFDKKIVKTPPQKQTKRAVVTTMSPDFDAVYGLNIDGEYVWAVHDLGDYMNVTKNNVNPAMYFLVEAMDEEAGTQVFYGLSPWSDIEWAYDTSDYAEMPVYGVSAQLRRDGSVVMAEAYGADMLIDGFGEPGRLFSVSSKGEFEWEYPELVCLVSDDSTDNGTVFVVTPDFTLRAISRQGNDLWDVIYDDTDSLLYCHPVAGSGAVVHFWAYIPDTNDLYADYVARVDSGGEVISEAWIEDPVNYYGYSVLFGDTFVVQDGEYALRAFDF